MSQFLKFYDKVLEKRRNDEIIKECDEERQRWKPSEWRLHDQSDYTDRITFLVCYKEWAPNAMRIGGSPTNIVLTLDDDDIDYLFNKYSKKLKDEMAAKISEIALLYKDKI